MKRYKINWTEESKQAAINKITEYLEKYGEGECIMQNDDALITAPEVFADIADNVIGSENIKYIENEE